MMTSAQVVETSVTTSDNISGLHLPERSNYTITELPLVLTTKKIQTTDTVQFIRSSAPIPNIGDREIGKGAKK